MVGPVGGGASCRGSIKKGEQKPVGCGELGISSSNSSRGALGTGTFRVTLAVVVKVGHLENVHRDRLTKL